MELLIRSERVVLADGIRAASVHVRDGTIIAVHEYGDAAAGVSRLDVGADVVLPGLVDTHVHINEPGRTEWEGFGHATRAAAAGGVTTLVDMPLNSIPSTTTVAALDRKRRSASGSCHVDVGFWGGVVPGNAGEIEALAGAGVLGFKCFLAPSGVEEFEHVSERDLREALPHLASVRRPLLAHAELPGLLREAGGASGDATDPRRYATWLASRPPASEHAAIDLLARLAAEHRAHIHIVHLAAAGALPALARYREAGVPLTVETCPHYLTFAAEDIPDGAPAFKCAPPIRERSHRELLWRGLADGTIDMIATDHSPAPPGLKRLREGDLLKAWGGIASLQIGLAAVWTGASSRGIPLDHVARWLSHAPARLAGLDARKGGIAAGRDADFVVFDPDTFVTVEPASLFHRHPVTPYAGLHLRGRVGMTLLRGEVVFRDGECIEAPKGRLLAGS